MSKKRKTLRDKKLAEFHRQETHQPKTTSGLTTSSSSEPIITTPTYTFTARQARQSVKEYSLQHDLYKTLSISVGIIVLQVIVFFLLQRHILVLPLIPLR